MIRLNDEANVDVLNSSFAAQQTRLFELDKKRSREVTLDKAGELNFANPIQQTAGLVAPQLGLSGHPADEMFELRRRLLPKTFEKPHTRDGRHDCGLAQIISPAKTRANI